MAVELKRDVAQSPSRMTLFTPISIANSRPLRATRVSIIEFAVRGRSWPNPPRFVPQHQYQHDSWLKRAPSKLILKLELSGMFNRSSIYICRPIYAWYVLANINICNHIMSYIIYIKFILFVPSDHLLIVIYIWTLFYTDYLLLPIFLFM